MNPPTPFPPLLSTYCLFVALVLGWMRYRVSSRVVDRRFPAFAFIQRVMSVLLAPVALVGDWTALSWAAYHWISPESVLASADIVSALLLEGVVALVFVCGFAFAKASVQSVHLPAPWLDKLIAARNSTGLGAFHE